MKLSHYQWDPVADLIAEGGFAEVFKAEDLNTPDRLVALKIYKEAVSRGTIGNTGRKKYSLEQEFIKVHQLSHTNIISYYSLDYIEHTDAMGRVVSYPVLIMEYAGEGTLADRIKTGLSEVSVKKIGIEITGAIQYLHDQGIVHRDLKPGNILFSKDNRGKYIVKVTDFGISQDVLSEKTIESSFTEGIGTPHYMAPEQFYKKKFGLNGEIGISTDIWAMGVLLYKMLTGKMPFGEGNKEYELVREEIVGQEPDYSQIPEFYEPIIRKCLQKNAIDRFNSMDEIVQHLSTDNTDRTVDLSSVSNQAKPLKSKEQSPWKYIVAALVIGGLIFGGYTFYNYQQKNKLLDLADKSYEEDEFKNAYESYLKASDYDSGKADYYLSSMNISGSGTKVNYTKAKEYAEKAVANDYTMAAGLLGDLYLKGLGVPIDTTKAIDNYRTAIPHLRELANKNEAEALSRIAILYYYGYAIKKDEKKYFTNTEKAAKKSHVSSMVNLGKAYHYGWGTEIDCDQALAWYEKGVDHKNMEANLSLGRYFYNGCSAVKKDVSKAMKYYKLAAKQGSVVAMYMIGYMYHMGSGAIKKDLDEALIWYNKAAEKEYAFTYNNLGSVYEAKKNFEKAEKWYLKANENNSVLGAYNVGNLYLNGHLGQVDLDLAKKYFEIASNKRHANATLELGKIYYFKEPYDYDKAYTYFMRADSISQDLAAIYLGNMFEFGYGKEIDLALAMSYYKKSVKKKDRRAEYAVGLMYYENKIKPTYSGEAKSWFIKAANQNYRRANYYLGIMAFNEKKYKEAKEHFDKVRRAKDVVSKSQLGGSQRYIGYMYDTGKGVRSNKFTAKRLYGYAAENGDKIGLYNLGFFYYKGIGTKINKKMAKTYMQKSCDLEFETACTFLKNNVF